MTDVLLIRGGFSVVDLGPRRRIMSPLQAKAGTWENIQKVRLTRRFTVHDLSPVFTDSHCFASYARPGPLRVRLADHDTAVDLTGRLAPRERTLP